MVLWCYGVTASESLVLKNSPLQSMAPQRTRLAAHPLAGQAATARAGCSLTRARAEECPLTSPSQRARMPRTDCHALMLPHMCPSMPSAICLLLPPCAPRQPVLMHAHAE